MIARKEVERLCALARLHLNEKETAALQKDLSMMLDYFKAIQKLDTADTEPTFNVTGMLNHLRADTPAEFSDAKKLASSAPHTNDDYVQVKSILSNED